jgi:hypothetical protein
VEDKNKGSGKAGREVGNTAEKIKNSGEGNRNNLQYKKIRSNAVAVDTCRSLKFNILPRDGSELAGCVTLCN